MENNQIQEGTLFSENRYMRLIGLKPNSSDIYLLKNVDGNSES